MKPQRVAQTDFRQLLECRALAVRAHDRAAPKSWIVDIDIFRRDVEIAADGKIDIFFSAQAIAQSRIPFEFVFVGGRTHSPTPRRINPKNPPNSPPRAN